MFIVPFVGAGAEGGSAGGGLETEGEVHALQPHDHQVPRQPHLSLGETERRAGLTPGRGESGFG